MKFYISNIHAWAPEIEHGLNSIKNENTSPKIEWTDPLFRRRFSQITKMTIQVLYDVINEEPKSKKNRIIFTSFRGEINREFEMEKMLIQEQDIRPASFSLSVFNTPIAAATIALNLKSGYNVIFPSKCNFSDALLAAVASIFNNNEKEILFVYADEKIPDEYKETLINYSSEKESIPLAFACILSSEKKENSKEFDTQNIAKTPLNFLKEIRN